MTEEQLKQVADLMIRCRDLGVSYKTIGRVFGRVSERTTRRMMGADAAYAVQLQGSTKKTNGSSTTDAANAARERGLLLLFLAQELSDRFDNVFKAQWPEFKANSAALSDAEIDAAVAQRWAA